MLDGIDTRAPARALLRRVTYRYTLGELLLNILLQGTNDLFRDCLAPCPGVTVVCTPEYIGSSCTSACVPPIRMVITGEARDW